MLFDTKKKKETLRSAPLCLKKSIDSLITKTHIHFTKAQIIHSAKSNTAATASITTAHGHRSLAPAIICEASLFITI